MIKYDNLGIEIQKLILSLVSEFLEKRGIIKFSYMKIIFPPNLPTHAILYREGNHLDVIELFF